MAPISYQSLALTTPGRGQGPLLVRVTDAIRLCREDGYRQLPAYVAVTWLDRLGRREMAAARTFVARVGLCPFPLQNLSDSGVLVLLRGRLRSGDLALVREGKGGAGEKDESLLKQRRLVREIEAKSPRRLSHGGCQYRLVPDVSLGKLADRHSYEVVSRRDAIGVLNALARQSGGGAGELAKLLTEAAGLLTQDWRPPFYPDGLVLLRKVIVQQSYKPDPGPALTPSQLKKLTETDWIEVELVDQDDEPYSAHYRLELPSGEGREGTFGADGFLGLYDIASGTCKLTLGETRQPAAADVAAPESVAAVANAATAEAQEPQEPAPPAELPVVSTTQHFEVRLVDDLDQGIPGVEVHFSSSGVTATATSDASGTAAVDLAGIGDAELAVPDPTALTAALKRRWDQVRGVENEPAGQG